MPFSRSINPIAGCEHGCVYGYARPTHAYRDLDLLSALAELKLVKVMVSVTTLDKDLKRKLEPRTASPATRLNMIHQLHAADIPVGVLIDPIIPFINDAELEDIVAAAADAGAQELGDVMLRLPHELVEIFEDWLNTHFPARKERVMNCIRNMRGGAGLQQ